MVVSNKVYTFVLEIYCKIVFDIQGVLLNTPYMYPDTCKVLLGGVVIYER